MARKKFTANERIVIRVEDESVSSTPVALKKAQNPKGIVENYIPEKYLPRRISGGHIKFYDLGREFINGNWTERVFNQLYPTPDLTVVNRMKEVLAVASANWKARYWRIQREEAKFLRFSFAENSETLETIKDETEGWTQKGLKFNENITRMRFLSSATNPGNHVFYDSFGALFTDWDTQDGNLKVTSLPDYNAVPATFSLNKGKDVDVYLNLGLFSTPLVRRTNYSTGDNVETLGGIISGAGWTNSQYPNSWSGEPSEPAQELIRTATEDSSNDYMHLGATLIPTVYRLISWRRNVVVPLYQEVSTYLAAFNQVMSVMGNNYSANFFNQVRANFVGYIYIALHTFPNGALFNPYFRGSWRGAGDQDHLDPPTVAGEYTGTQTDTSIGGFNITTGQNYTTSSPPITLPGGTLLAAINQADKWYYVWKYAGGGGGT